MATSFIHYECSRRVSILCEINACSIHGRVRSLVLLATGWVEEEKTGVIRGAPNHPKLPGPRVFS